MKIIATVLIGFFGPSISLGAQASGSSSETRYSIPAVEIRPSNSAPRSYVGREFDHEIERQSLREQQSNTITDVIEEIPGLDNLSGPRKDAQAVTIRAFSPKQVLTLLDGSRQNFQMTHNSIISVRMHLLKQMNVLKGGASSRFGSGALGGLVSFTTLSPQDLTGTGEGQSLQLRQLHSSVSHMNQYSLTGASSWEGGRKGLIIDSTRSGSGNIRLSDAQNLSYSGYTDFSVWAKGSYQPSAKHALWLSVERFSKDSKTPFNPQADAFSEGDVAVQEEIYRVLKAHYKSHKTAGFRPEVMTYVSETEMDRKRLSDQRRDIRKVQTFGGAFHGTYDIISDANGWVWSLKPGAELVRDVNFGSRNGEELASFPDGESLHSGIYILSDFSVGRWWIDSGVRWDEMHLEAESGLNRKDEEWSPQIKIGRFLTENLSFSLSYEEGYNAPKIQDMFVDGLHFQDGDFLINYFIPNPDLQAETSETYEASVVYDYSVAGSRGKIQWSEYTSSVENYIDQEIRLAEEETQFVNRSQVEFRGRELSWMQSLGLIELNAGFSQVRSYKAQNNQPLSRTPQDHVFVGLSYQPGSWTLGISGHAYGEQDRVDETQFENIPITPGFELLHSFVAYKWETRQSQGTARLRVNNILEREYRLHGTPLKGPGRDVRLELVLAL